MAEQEKTIQAFEQAFQKLKSNREKVPLEQLTTRYAKAYTALVDEVKAGAEWFTGCYIKTLSDSWPLSEKDTAGNEWLQKKQAAILQRERQPGGLYDQQIAALVDQLDIDRYYDLVWQLYNRLEIEAFDPYWQRHNYWVGNPGHRWVYNDIIKQFWYPPGKNDHWPDGCWINSQYQVYSTNYPPHIAESKE